MGFYDGRKLVDANLYNLRVGRSATETAIHVGFDVTITNQEGGEEGPSVSASFWMEIDPGLPLQDVERAASDRAVELLKRVAQETPETIFQKLTERPESA